MKLKLFVIAILLVVGAGASVAALGGLPTDQAAAAGFLTTTVSRGSVTDDAAATGTVEPSRSYGLGFGSAAHPVSDNASDSGSGRTWRAVEVAVKVGDAVSSGQILARADTTAIRAELVDAANTLNAARQQLLIAEDAMDAADTTDGRRRARIDLYAARTQLSQARQAHSSLRTELAAAWLRSPIDGIVTALDIVAGLDAPSGDAIVVQATDYVVRADVVESDLPSVSMGQEAAVTIDALDAELRGRVTSIAPEATTSDTGVVSYAVTVSVVDPPNGVRAGMTADVTITLAEATDVLTVPASALIGGDGDYLVRVLGADGTPELRPVTVGLVTNTAAEITYGLAEGETVITGTAAEAGGDGLQGPGAIPIPGGGGPGGGFVRDAGAR